MQGRLLIILSAVAIALATASFGFATETANSTISLIGPIARLAEQPPDEKQSLETARKRLSSSLETLEQLLARSKGDTATRWSKWLDLPAIHEQLAAEQPNLTALKSIEARLYQNCEGLELPAFVAVRRDLVGFRIASEYAADQSPQELYRQRVTELAECFRRMAEHPTYADGHQAGLVLGWVEALDQNGASLASDVRKQLCHINATAQASARLANVLFQRSVSERNYIAETVLGSYMRGVAITQGQLALGMAPSDDHGTLEILLRGQVSYPANVADRRRISVYSSGYTTIDAKKNILVDDQGLRLARAAAQAATSVNIQDIEAPRVLERISWRRASRMTPEAEAMTSRRAESQAASSLDQQADASLGKINNTFCQKIRAPLIRFNALPEDIHVWTDPTHLHLSWCQHSEFQLAVTGPAPALLSGYDIGGCVHESMINNLAEPTLGGKSLEDETWLEMMHLILGAPPRALWVHDRAERWSVTFEKELPVVTRFDADRVAIKLHLAGVTRGGRRIEKPAEIEVSFIPKISKEGPVLVRDGELVVRVQNSAEQESDSFRDFLMRKFGAIFPPEIYFYGLTPPAGGALGKLQLLKPVEFRSEGGWLTLAYQLEGSLNPATLPIARSDVPPTGVR